MSSQPAPTLRKRQAYWIADVVTAAMQARATMLAGKGVEVRFFTSLELLLATIEERRAAIIIISDDGDESRTERILTTLTTMPEIQGARLVMVRGKTSEWLSFLAAAGNVRDIIPAHLDDRQWLARFLFATAARAVPFVQPPGQMTLANISAVSIPARMTWISDGKLRIESRLRPPAGANLTLTGPLADSLGVSAISLTVLGVERSRLVYRFSDAIIAAWSVPAAERARATAVLADLREHSPGARCRVFVAISTLSLRTQLLERFDDPRFEVSTALQKQSIVDEPRFFTPDVVLIEDTLCGGDERPRFDQMLANLTEHTTVIILGKVADLPALQRQHPTRRILQLERLPKTLTESILTRHGLGSAPAAEAGIAHVLAEHPYSLAALNIPARLTRIHPHAAQLALPYAVSNFALCRIESPLLRKLVGRSPYFKVTATYPDMHPEAGAFRHIVEGYLADLESHERQSLAHGLTRLISDSMGRPETVAATPSASRPFGDAVRTPEIGSVRAADTNAQPNNVVRLPPPPKTRPTTAAATTPRAATTSPAVSTVSVSGTSTAPSVAPAGASVLAGGPSVGGGKHDLGGAAAANLDEAPTPALHAISAEEQRLIPARELAEFIKPALVEVAEEITREVTDLGQDVVQGVRRTVKKDYVTQTITAVLVIGTMLLLFWIGLRFLEPNWERSGSVYSDQLKKFAPHLNQPQR